MYPEMVVCTCVLGGGAVALFLLMSLLTEGELILLTVDDNVTSLESLMHQGPMSG